MPRFSPQLRACLSALLLVVQVLGLGHVALAKHTLSESGALVDAAPLLVEVHDDAQTHLCAEDVEIHADAPDDCLVVATWSAPMLLAAAALPHRFGPPPSAGLAAVAVVGSPLDALVRAPKASPPRG